MRPLQSSPFLARTTATDPQETSNETKDPSVFDVALPSPKQRIDFCSLLPANEQVSALSAASIGIVGKKRRRSQTIQKEQRKEAGATVDVFQLSVNSGQTSNIRHSGRSRKKSLRSLESSKIMRYELFFVFDVRQFKCLVSTT